MLSRTSFFVIVFFIAGQGMGQVPPGDPYDASKHPNAILTYVESSGFRPVTFQEAADAARIEILGLPESAGKRELLAIADGGVRKVKLLGRSVEVTFYPVVQEAYTLADGSTLVLHSFKNPKVPFLPRMAERVLNESAFAKTKKLKDARFGSAQAPEQLEVRGVPALLFNQDGRLTLFWQERGASHTVTASINRKQLIRLLEDLL